MEIVMLVLETLRRVLHRAGPYLLVEILLPGGTLLALTLFLYRRKIFSGGMSIRRPAIRL
jgi:hypothetical protein